MRCVYCGNSDTKVTNKRDGENGFTRRRRECIKCKKRFTTFERPEIEIIVVKKDNSRQEYNRDKLFLGIIKACEKRPVSREAIEKIIEDIEEKIRNRGKEIQSKFIGELVMKALKKIDKIAYIRFASVYRDFQDVGDFKKEIQNLNGS